MSLYGLKQASQKWYEKLFHLLIQLGFRQATADHSLFIRKSPSSFVALLIYAVDIVLVRDSIPEIASIKTVLDQQFGIMDLGILKFFLG